MYLFNALQQNTGIHRQFRADGSIATGGTSQLLVPAHQERASFFIQNISTGVMYLESGAGRATAVLTSGVVTSITITNGGFGFSIPPAVRFLGGAGYLAPAVATSTSDPSLPSPGSTGWPGRSAVAHCVLTGGVVTSIVVDDGGSGYISPPYVQLVNADADPFGCSDPFYGSANSGVLIGANGGSFLVNGTTTHCEPMAIWGATDGQKFTVGWM